jgi:hypothetical protein
MGRLMVRKILYLIACLICCAFAAGVSDARTARPKAKAVAKAAPKPKQKPEQQPPGPVTILSPAEPTGAGVNITTAEWDMATDHVDKTYLFFQQVHKGDFGRYDFYYRLELVPQFSESFKDCATDGNFTRFFNNLFGTTDGALITVQTNIQHRWSNGSATDLLKGNGLLIMAAKGPSSTTVTAGNGCFFDFTVRPTFPWVLWNGGRADRPEDNFDDFQIKFIVANARTTSYNLVQNAIGLFTDLSVAARWTQLADPLASKVFGGVQNAATIFQTALQKADTYQNQISKVWYLKSFFADHDKQNGRILVTIPNLFGDADNGSMAIYVRRQGSIALQGSGPITEDTIFNTVELAYRQCSLGQIASGSCSDTSNDTVRASLLKALKKIDTKLDEANPIQPLFEVTFDPKAVPIAAPAPAPVPVPAPGVKGDGATPAPPQAPPTNPDRRKLVFDLCRGMRVVSTLQLHLSTLDEMAVRWAFTQEGGLQEELAKASASDELKSQFQKDFGHPWEDVVEQCWNEGDDDTLAGVTAKLNRPLVRKPFPKDVVMKWPKPAAPPEPVAPKQ